MAIEGLFGAIPARAFADDRLHAPDFRVLGAIALHDQGGSNGQGCWAGLGTLQRETALPYVSAVSESISRLVKLGYIARRTNPNDARRIVLRVIYAEPQDRSAVAE